MVKERLEIRGISRKDVCKYVVELGGVQVSDTLFRSNGWNCIVSEEETFHFLQSDVPKVYVTFEANDRYRLTSILASFRKKTFRVGG
ncbi:hypothetical protein J2S74_003235 [Evansella vedderi]|uniref:Molybdopterin cofactor biosynthesis MoaD-related C-terminal domain-containing protein n=1 Tax=Evansella vedderi TaxID=38282 RepID=A0ABT9ZYS5_9BACI|nr:hypothetical protein [Evansella vedderi]MDQ0255851.1 hypothetical protein [Evansella vedderi]